MSKYFATLNKIAILGLLIGLFALAPLGAQSAEAQSVYDNVFYKIDNLYIPDYQQGTTNEYIYEYVESDQDWWDAMPVGQNKIDALTRIDNGGDYLLLGQNDQIKLIEGDFETGFYMYSGSAVWGITSGTYNVWNFTKVNGVGTDTGSWQGLSGNYPIYYGDKPDPVPTTTGIYRSTAPNTYPEGYEGETIESTGGSTIPDYDDTGSIYYKVIDKYIQWWSTTPDVDPGVACRYMLIKNNSGETPETLYDTLGNCKDVHDYVVDEYGSYLVEVEYIYDINGDGILTPDLEAITIKQENVEIDGRTFEGGTYASGSQIETCFVDGFPGIDFEGCVNNMKLLVNVLSFNTIKWSGNWRSTMECKQLAVLDDWLHLSNSTVCPAFPAEVRNIVTPFITIALGLTTVRFIVRHTGNTM